MVGSIGSNLAAYPTAPGITAQQQSANPSAKGEAEGASPSVPQKGTAAAGNAQKTGQESGKSGGAEEQSPEVQAQVQELLQIQNKVIVHEQAHMSVGGDLAGSPSYSYTTGPDGKRYISGGEVSISTPEVEKPEEQIRLMQRVQAAALAPADPSPQDMRVASGAAAKQSQAVMELARQRMEAAYGTGKKSGAEDAAKIPGTPEAKAAESEKAKDTGKTSGSGAAIRQQRGAAAVGQSLDITI